MDEIVAKYRRLDAQEIIDTLRLNNLTDVEAIVIGGGLGTRLADPFVDRIREAMQPHLFRDDVPPAVHPAALGDLGGAIGAARLVR